MNGNSTIEQLNEIREAITQSSSSITSSLYTIDSSIQQLATAHTWYKDPQWWAVITALLLGVIGVFQDYIKGLFKRPKLVPSIRMNPPDCHKIPMTNTATGEFMYDTYYLRFFVENKGDFELKNVEVMATELWKLQDDTSFKKQNSFLPLNLVWAHQHLVTMPTIQPGTFKHCDFGHVFDYTELRSAVSREVILEDAGMDIIMVLDSTVQPNTFSNIIKPGTYKIKVLFSASNHKPVEKIYKITLINNWSDDEEVMLRDYIQVVEDSI